MRDLTPTLLAAQSSSVRIPAVSLVLNNLPGGKVSLLWERLYTGAEPSGAHSLTLAGNGALVRFRCGPVSDSRKLYRQRIVNPGSTSDFSAWTFFSQYNVTAVASCARDTEIGVFWAKTNGDICYMQSTDYGASWGATQYPGTAPTGSVAQMAVAYKYNGDIAVFFVDASTLYVIRRINGVWQSRIAWSHSTGTLTGVAVIYDRDWKLLVAGRDSGGNHCVWSLIYGDGGEVPAGSWSALKPIAQTPADSPYSSGNVSLAEIASGDIRCFYLENYSGNPAGSRPFWSSLVSSSYQTSLWHEPVPFDSSTPDCPAVAKYGEYIWLATPAGVWRANCTVKSFNAGPDILSLRLDVEENEGRIQVELDNHTGKYSNPGADSLETLRHGANLEFRCGYLTAAGNEYSENLSFCLQRYTLASSPGKAVMVLEGVDGWQKLAEWSARYSLRFTSRPVKDILEEVLARSGMRLEVISQSSLITAYCPDFTIQPGDNGKEVVVRLLAMVPDVLFLEGWTAFLSIPLPLDNLAFQYGTTTPILEGRYEQHTARYNHILVEGSGASSEVFDWEDIAYNGDRFLRIEDSNITTLNQAQERGNAVLRKFSTGADAGFIRVPVNCGQQLYDAISITDSLAGLYGIRRRVRAISTFYQPKKASTSRKLQSVKCKGGIK